jgi:hypothetical protein
MAGAIVAALAAPHGLVSWHGEGMDTARHLIVAVLQLQLGAVLMAIGAVAGRAPIAGRRGGRTGPCAGRSSGCHYRSVSVHLDLVGVDRSACTV